MNKSFAKLVAALFALSGISIASAQGGAPFLWEIKGKQATHYLMGSVHMLPAESQPLPPALLAAYGKVDALVFETDLAALSDPKVQMSLLTAGDAPKGIKSLIGAPLYKKLEERAKALALPLDETCDHYKPWFCAMTLEALSFARSGYQPQYGLDQVFYVRALNDDKPMHWLEETSKHLQIFTTMPAPLSTEFLRSTLEELADANQAPAELFRMWRENDVSALEKITHELKRTQPRAYERLLAARTRAWIAPLQKLLDSKESQLIIVGAAHTAGRDGLLTLLHKAGYAITSVAADVPAAAEAASAPAVKTSPASEKSPQ
jgi:uncharacterized protein YbaP (TraB family)